MLLLLRLLLKLYHGLLLLLLLLVIIVIDGDSGVSAGFRGVVGDVRLAAPGLAAAVGGALVVVA